MSASANPIELEVRGLRVEFAGPAGAVKAVDGIDYSLRRGEILAIVGESGCGKTASALAVPNLLPAPGAITGGAILFDRRDLTRLPARELRQLRGRDIAMIFQDPQSALNPVLSAGAQIAEALLRHLPLSRREARERALLLLQQVGIPAPAQKLDAYPHQLSGGMQQRVMIAMALSCSPRVLLADEPTTALDALVQKQILTLLRQQRDERQLAVILITHDLGVVAETADRALVMYAGKIVEAAPAASLCKMPAHPYTAGLLASRPKLGEHARRSRLMEIKGQAPRRPPGGCAFHPRCPAVMEICRQQAPDLKEIQPGHLASCWLC